MCTVKGIVAYTAKKYTKDDLTLDRLTKVVFLADWKAAIDCHDPITNIKWHMVGSEPRMDEDSLDEVVEFVENSQAGKASIRSILGSVLRPKDKLSPPEKSIVNSIIEKASIRSDQEFSLLVHSTFPALKPAADEPLDLTSLAREYVEEVRSGLPPEEELQQQV